MPYRFKKHYTPTEARALLPQVRSWLEEMDRLRDRLHLYDKRLSVLVESGRDTGGEMVETWIRLIVDVRALLLEFQTREILIKDFERGLVDFPALIGGKEVFLCWKKDEDDVEFWHDLDSGYAGREPL
jgi:hypothetical protein